MKLINIRKGYRDKSRMKDKIEKRYLISWGAQEELIKKCCFDKCGAISVTGVVNFEGGDFGFCCQEKCPFLDKQVDCGNHSLIGEKKKYNIIVRKLKEMKT